ncbi:hypothetical protein JKP88DRAFT_242723 [Tribonema minus]|uniref:Uncharacterized protein n=1 Tax=Tribonema minus TaxID=303371 RepID=A0A835ZDQ3_9STRA|nr:hypothetical protein JKP88DRAFT_242723 [Tribonema minus]
MSVTTRNNIIKGIALQLEINNHRCADSLTALEECCRQDRLTARPPAACIVRMANSLSLRHMPVAAAMTQRSGAAQLAAPATARNRVVPQLAGARAGVATWLAPRSGSGAAARACSSTGCSKTVRLASLHGLRWQKHEVSRTASTAQQQRRRQAVTVAMVHWRFAHEGANLQSDGDRFGNDSSDLARLRAVRRKQVLKAMARSQPLRLMQLSEAMQLNVVTSFAGGERRCKPVAPQRIAEAADAANAALAEQFKVVADTSDAWQILRSINFRQCNGAMPTVRR